MSVILWVAVFIASLVVVIKASDYFTEAAEKIGIKLGMPAFIVGVTIVAVGTSLPELISSLFAVFAGASEIVAGTVIGSNIANIFLVLGVASVFAIKIKTDYEILKVDLPIFFASALFLFITFFDGIFNFWEGLFGIAGVVTYFTFAGMSAKKVGSEEEKEIKKEKKELKKEGVWFQFIIVVVSGFFIFVGAKYLVDSIIELSVLLNLGKELIAISAVAIGTSLPELFVGIQAVRKGNAGMAFGNVLGSNIFNSFAVMGIPALIAPIIIPEVIINLSLPVLLGATFLYIFMTQDRELTIWEGIILLLAYALYICKIFSLF